VHDTRKPFLCKQLRHRLAVHEINVLKVEFRMLAQQRQPSFLQADIVVAVEVVETDYFIAAGQQPLRGVEADKAGCAGHQDFFIRHLCPSSQKQLEVAPVPATNTCRRSPLQ